MEKYVEKAVSWDRLGISFEQARPFQKANNVKAFIHVLSFLGLLSLSALGVLFFAVQGWWLAFVLALYVHGGLMPFCDSPIHELTHNTLFTKKSYNLFFARLFSLLYWRINYAFFRTSHAKHHAYTQMQMSDGENMVPRLFTRKIMLTGLMPVDLLNFAGALYRLLTLRPILLRNFNFTAWEKHLLDTSKGKLVGEIYYWSYICLLFHLAILLIALASGFWLLPLVTTLAPFYGARWYHQYIGATQHAGMAYNNNRFSENSRSIKLDPLSSFLYFNMEYHVEHHMFASIPCYRLKEFRKAFQGKFPRRITLFQAIVQMLKLSTALKQQLRLHEVEQ